MTTFSLPLAAFGQELGRFFEQAADAGEWTPTAAISEDDHQITLELDLPGVKQEDVTINVEKNQLALRGERKPTVNLDSYRRVEARYGVFGRVFNLPETVRQDAITAELRNGVLRVNLPKREEVKPRQIPVGIQTEGAK